MGRFFKKLLVVVLSCYGLLLVLQLIVDAGLRKSSGDYTDMNRIFEGKIKDRLVIFGNSRAQAHFDPLGIEKQTGISAYNLGTPGVNLDFERVKWRSFLAHNRPEIVVQNVDVLALSDKNIADKKPFLPYYSQPEMLDLLCQHDAAASIEKWIPMSKYRGFEPLVLQGIGGWFKKGKAYGKSKGYQKHTQSWNGDFERFIKELHGKNVDYSTTQFRVGFERLQQEIDDCKERNILLILVWTPQYRGLSKLQEPTFSRIKRQVAAMAGKNGVAFWDFSNNSITDDQHYFYNSFHMNVNGVEVFTRQFADSLKTLKWPVKP